MAQIAGLSDLRGHGAPADIGTFISGATAITFQFTFSGVNYICSMAVGPAGWVLLSYAAAGTDDVKIQAAVDYLQALGGGKLVILGGTYDITVAITITNGNVVVVGVGWETHLLASVDTHIFDIDGPAADNRIEGVVLRDMHLEGTDEGNFDGVNCLWSDLMDIYNLRVTNFGRDGIRIDTCSFCDVHGNLVEGVDDTGIRVTGGTSHDNSIKGNKTGYNQGVGLNIGGDHATIFGNNSYHNTSFGIYVTGVDQIAVGNASNYNGSHGLMLMCGFSLMADNLSNHNSGSGIYVLGLHNAISGNHINHHEGDNLAGIYLASGSDYCAVVGNTIREINPGHVNGDGIVLDTSDHNTIAGNTISLSTRDGIRLSAAENNLIGLNTLSSNGGYGIFIGTASIENQIQNNYTENNTTACLRIDNANCVRNLISGNCFDEGNISDVGGGHGCVAFLNYDPSAGAFIATINPPAIVGGGGGNLP